jgi:hypothetical protein
LFVLFKKMAGWSRKGKLSVWLEEENMVLLLKPKFSSLFSSWQQVIFSSSKYTFKEFFALRAKGRAWDRLEASWSDQTASAFIIDAAELISQLKAGLKHALYPIEIQTYSDRLRRPCRARI